MATEETSLKGSYRSKSEFAETVSDAGLTSHHQEALGDSLNCSSSSKSSSNSLTWDTLKKIRRQKSRRNTNELKKYQSTVCIYGQNSLTSPSEKPPPHGLRPFLEYEDVYRSSPSLCGRSLATSRHLSSSHLKFTGEKPIVGSAQ